MDIKNGTAIAQEWEDSVACEGRGRVIADGWKGVILFLLVFFFFSVCLYANG